MLRIWGRISSINVRKVAWAAQELELPYERIDAGGSFGVVHGAQYRALNPNALVPVIEDGTTTLWESNTIVRYLAAQYPRNHLLPTVHAQRFLAEQWMDWQQTTLNPAGRDAFVQLVRTPAEQRNMALVDKSVAATNPLLDLLDRHLAQHAYLIGSHFSVADIPVGCELHRWYALPQERVARPNLDRWYANLQARAASHGVLNIPLS